MRPFHAIKSKNINKSKMASIHYFQRYSQKENVVTNNTLLLLARIYEISPNKFQSFLTSILEEEIEVGVSFLQQIKGQGAIPDGFISQKSFQIIIETKRGGDFRLEQLINHLNIFGKEEQKFLLAVGAKEVHPNIIKQVEEKIKEDKKQIKVSSTTFKDIIEILEALVSDYDFELKRLVDDYRDFCFSADLIPDDEYLMRLVLANKSMDENFKFDIYYDNKGFREHKYIGLYGEKSIRGIGEIINIISADLENENIIMHNSRKPVSEVQKNKIKELIGFVSANKGWDISHGSTFFLVEKFEPTDFKKITKNAPMGNMFFDLRKVLKREDLPDTKSIAELLKSKIWRNKHETGFMTDEV